MGHVLYMEWALLGPEGESPAQLVAELGRAHRGRLAGSRGVHASFVLQDGPRLVVLMIVESRGMLEAYARWTRLRVQPRLGVGPSRLEAFELLGAAEGAARLFTVMDAPRAA